MCMIFAFSGSIHICAEILAACTVKTLNTQEVWTTGYWKSGNVLDGQANIT